MPPKRWSSGLQVSGIMISEVYDGWVAYREAASDEEFPLQAEHKLWYASAGLVRFFYPFNPNRFSHP